MTITGQTSTLWILLGAYVLPYIAVASIALCWPSQSSPFGLDFADTILARLVPSVSGYIKRSHFPHATAAYFVLFAVLFLPYLILGLLRPLDVLYFGSVRRMDAYKREYQARSGLTRTIALLFCPAAIWVAWMQPGYQFGLLPVHEARWALAIGGPLLGFYTMSYFILLGIVMSVRFWPAFRIPRQPLT
ncbi:hypothetical protein [Cupriavidus sp. L7L]|uniref:hypothetical protein n=1 Tax=Cupriavidus sp. L7L TaxID=2546443 RepID=UPI001054E6A5|nr:hypothetical protein [Cupriavidus sp. L7L]TDF62864.1 hypothetical protein E1J61_26785 [Cupriavidus sp. L7L]